MPDEQDFTTHLRTYQDAVLLLTAPEDTILEYAWRVYLDSMEIEAELAARRRQPTSTPPVSHSDDPNPLQTVERRASR
jgi:hypothetical protein